MTKSPPNFMQGGDYFYINEINYLFIFAQESLSVTVRLNTR